jgi:ubiquinone/menaquinone biosynthesis C-methylase UbiE
MTTAVDRWRYYLGQGARSAWFRAENRLALWLASRGGTQSGAAAATPASPAQAAERQALARAYRALVQAEAAHIAAGTYRLPERLLPDPASLLADGWRFFRDLPAVLDRRGAAAGETLAGADMALPDYYRRAFHFQTDGYLSPASARLYDHQVDVLFWGAAGAMRRQALAPIRRHLANRDQRGARLLDLASGSGDFLLDLRDNYPRLGMTGLDLSAAYLGLARGRLANRYPVGLVQALAEALPFADSSHDLVTCVYLLHELPEAVRRAVAVEIGRVLRPGGCLVLVDSLQLGDVPDLDPALDRFPWLFHEPYYASYVATDLDQHFGRAGLRAVGHDLAFLSKVSTFVKPGA